MTDYSKETVARLRQILKEKGIPSTGLTRKQQIIEKIQEFDAAKAAPVPAAAPSEVEESPEGASPVPEAAIEAANNATIEKVSAADGEPEVSAAPTLAHHESIKPTEVAPAAAVESHEQDGKEVVSAAEAEVAHATQPDVAVPAPGLEPTTTTAPAEPSSSSTRVNTEEIVEESRKRKRRSPTPSINPEAAAKKLKQDESADVVHLPEDAPMSDAPHASHNGHVEEVREGEVEETKAAAEEAPVEMEVDSIAAKVDDKAPENGDAEKEPEAVPADMEAESTVAKDDTENPVDIKQPETTNVQAEHEPAKSSSPVARKASNAARYKDLFQPSETASTTAADANAPTTTEPAIHPETTAVYIRNLQRPLAPSQFRNKMIALATPAGAEPDPTILETCHLDNIRTHAFVRFTSKAAAALVRASLHDQVWPAERDRKPLWVDFIPEDKLDSWISVENSGTDTLARNNPLAGKKWEVIYKHAEDDSNAVEALLVEAGGNAHLGAPYKGNSSSNPPPSGPSGGPHDREEIPPPAPNDDDDEVVAEINKKPVLTAPTQPEAALRSVMTLDNQFPHTTAKPKLYYQPVSKKIAEKRRDMIEMGTARDYNESKLEDRVIEHRFTFAKIGADGEERLVDTGYHHPGRGGGSYRGGGRGGGGGYGGRGGSYRSSRR
ncbi:hypothetical protein K402DRAFT_392224 [Aulographum hederae CBS 113979]|uniref:SAP domain-containing protein n=1 Tax=Aulographum hederae CBS 113979 TaxID=1176131 RepID=A0A6G1H4J3_9PEZI|nr:hypothetical protein K402DRAFT_392224 [Aulographum hederae CBS 113979]